MRKGREGLAEFVREKMQRDPYIYGDAFIFYSKDLKKVKILHYDINGFVIYENDYRPMIPCYYTPKKSRESRLRLSKSRVSSLTLPRGSRLDRRSRSLDTIKWRKVQSDKFFQKIMFASLGLAALTKFTT